MMKRCYIWILVCWTGTWGVGTVMGQHHQGGNVSSSFAKFVDIPVSHYTGVPQIGIPLATAQEGPLKVPISLAYHSSGVKVGELASEIGLGWQLMGGGAIYRNVRGMMDEDTRNSRKGYYLHGSTMTNTTTTLNEIQNGSRDGEADLFSFYMPGYSGKFYFEGGNGSTPSDVVLVPEQDLQVEVTDIECPSNGFCYIRGFKIIAPDGTRYYFGKYNPNADFAVDRTINTDLSGSDPLYDMATGWHLAKIETYDGKNDIIYKHLTSNYEYETLAPSSLKIVYNGSPTQTPIHAPSTTTLPSSSIRYYTMNVYSKVLDSIITRTQVFDFDHEDRTDVSVFTTPSKKWAISGLKVYEGSTHCVSYVFDQSYFTDGTSPTDPYRKRLKLDQVQKKSCDNTEVEPAYTLNYIEPDGLAHRLSKAMDHWGYYNGKTTNNNTNVITLIPVSTYIIPNGTASFNYGHANRDTDTVYAKKGLLDKVTYPTGGHTAFTYEGHKALDQNAPGAKTPIAYLATGQDTSTQHCNIAGYEANAYQTLTQEKIDNGYFSIGVSNHIGGCGNPTTNVRVDVIQGGQIKITREINHNAPCETGKVALAGNGINTSQTVRFKLTTNNEGEGFADIWYHPNSISDVAVGGMRIKTISTHDAHDSNKDIVRSFKYRRSFNDDKSSADYIGNPIYGKLVWNSPASTYTLMAEPFSLAPLSSFEGYHIGYERVEEALNGNGHNVYTFRAENFEHDAEYPSPGLAPRVLAGTAEKSMQYNESQSMLASNSSTEKQDYYSTPGHFSIAFRAITGIPTIFTNTLYYNPTRKPFRPATTINYLEGVETETTYGYSSNALQLQPNDITFTNSDGKETTTSIKYTGHYDQVPAVALFSYFRTNNIIGIPYETTTTVDGNVVDGSRTTWSFYNSAGLAQTTSAGNFPYPKAQQRYERTWNASGTIQAGAWRTLDTILEYDMRFGFAERRQESGWSERTTVFDALGNVKKSQFNGFETENFYFSGSSLLERTKAVDGQQTSYTYDKLLRPATVNDLCSGTVTQYDYVYDDASNQHYNKVVTTTDYVMTGSPVDIIQDIDYLDGLGRKVQTVRKNQSQSSNRDIVLAVEYDKQGRIARKYEPLLSTLTSGNYVTVTSGSDHTLSTYEPSPLNRISKVTPPFLGTTDYSYGTNGSEVSGYTASSLTKQQVKDGNGHYAVSYTDKKGRKILSRRTTNPSGTIHNDTRYIYDDKDRLTTALPPGATILSTPLIYTYTYDARDQIILKGIPGKDAMEYRYNARNLLSYMQDGYLSNESKWYAYQYDAHGRETKSGFSTSVLANNNHTSAQVTLSELLTEDIYGTVPHEKDKLKTSKSKILGTSDWLINTVTYDNCGRVTNSTGNSIVNIAGTTSENRSYTYDWMDNLLNETYVHNVNAHTIQHIYTYDKVGRQDLYSHKLDAASPKRITNFDFNHKEEMTLVAIGPTSQQIVNYTYKPNGLLASTNSTALTGGDLFYEELRYKDNLVPNSGASVQYNGNIANVISRVQGNNQQVYGMTYDYLDRMDKATYVARNTSGTSQITNSLNDYTVDPSYDLRGNITSLTRQGKHWNGTTYVQSQIDNLSYTVTNNMVTNVVDNAPAATKGLGYHKKGSGNYTYSTNGNLLYDPRSDADFTYNHLDVPTRADFGNGKTIDWTYDARGNMLRKVVKDGSVVMEDRKYVGEIEYGGSQIEMIYHPGGRIYNTDYVPDFLYLDGTITGTQSAEALAISSTARIHGSANVDYKAENCITLEESFEVELGSEFDAIITPLSSGVSWRYDYFIRDHLGNTRVVFDESNQILAHYEYYPFGMTKTGEWGANTSLNKEKYQYNGIEYLNDHGLNINMARYRMLDPSIGRWLGVDPAADATMGMSPYNSMGNSPMMYSDPEGDIPLLVGAAIGVIANGIGNSFNNQPFFRGWGESAFFGAFGAGAANAIGGIASGIAGASPTSNTLFAAGAFQAGSHAVVGGAVTMGQGGRFGSGALSGGLSSIAGSFTSGFGTVGQYGVGAVTGGLGSVIGGGDFWQGAAIGAIVTGLNHAAHSGVFGQSLAASLLTGRIRHLFGPDARGVTANIDLVGGGGTDQNHGLLEILVGPETKDLMDIAAALSLLDSMFLPGSK